MQSIKFISLIVICATSCLALILPAVGVVPFPKQLSGVNSQGVTVSANGVDAGGRSALTATDPSIGSGGLFNSTAPNAAPWSGGAGNQNLAGISVSGMPVSTTGVSGYQSSPTLAGTDSQVGIDLSGSQSATVGGLSKYDSLGFGIWLLLVPIWLVSLMVWSLTPTPQSRSK